MVSLCTFAHLALGDSPGVGGGVRFVIRALGPDVSHWCHGGVVNLLIHSEFSTILVVIFHSSMHSSFFHMLASRCSGVPHSPVLL